MKNKREWASQWFESLRDKLCAEFELIEQEYANYKKLVPAKFKRKSWQREGGGGGIMSIMHGNVFEKIGVNISTVHGKFTKDFAKQIPGTEKDPSFFATGVSLVSHMSSPLVPAAHFNTRYIETSKSWFGGGGDLTPIYEDINETEEFHSAFKKVCDKYDSNYYEKFKKQCDEYFYLKHRNEARGVGGIFYDYLGDNFDENFSFTKDVGIAMLKIYPKLVRKKIYEDWTDKQREYQLVKRGRYVEFNLLYDRGTRFGLSTGGNVDAILMSMPPQVKWE